MVQAILAGRKTQTRRVIKDQPKHNQEYGQGTTKTGDRHWVLGVPGSSIVDVIKCPYGQPGDVLWVREIWGIGKQSGKTYYKADAGYFHMLVDKWIPSIHMPKDEARIWLRITNVRVEPLWSISEDDALSEGIEEIHPAPFVIRYKNYLDTKKQAILKDPTLSFRTLWESINGADGWYANPWVWVVEFERIEKPKSE